MQNTFLKTRLKSGELTIGSWISFGYTPTCEIMAKAGFDWLVIDLEHSAISIETCESLIRAIVRAGSVDLPPELYHLL